MLDHVSEWCKKWQLKINPDKTQIIHFRGKQKPKTNHTFHCSENDIKIVPSYKYLGVILDEFLTYEPMCICII